MNTKDLDYLEKIKTGEINPVRARLWLIERLEEMTSEVKETAGALEHTQKVLFAAETHCHEFRVIQDKLRAEIDTLRKLASTYLEDCDREQARAEAAEARLQAEQRRREEIEAHEQQTHAELGAILGTDTSLLEGAQRLQQRREMAEARVQELGETLQDILDCDECRPCKQERRKINAALASAGARGGGS